MKVYGIFYTYSDDCTYSCESLQTLVLYETEAELLVLKLNEKENLKYPRWSVKEVEVVSDVHYENINEMAEQLMKGIG